jgi:hypothetical protein
MSDHSAVGWGNRNKRQHHQQQMTEERLRGFGAPVPLGSYWGSSLAGVKRGGDGGTGGEASAKTRAKKHGRSRRRASSAGARKRPARRRRRSGEVGKKRKVVKKGRKRASKGKKSGTRPRRRQGTGLAIGGLKTPITGKSRRRRLTNVRPTPADLPWN